MPDTQPPSKHEYKQVSRCQSVAAVLWPSFLAAGLATTLFFAFFDPLAVSECTGHEGISRMGAYSVGFFMFWAITAASSCATQYFLKPCELVNRKK